MPAWISFSTAGRGRISPSTSLRSPLTWMSDIISAGVLADATVRRMNASSSVIGSSAGRIEMVAIKTLELCRLIRRGQHIASDAVPHRQFGLGLIPSALRLMVRPSGQVVEPDAPASRRGAVRLAPQPLDVLARFRHWLVGQGGYRVPVDLREILGIFRVREDH